MLSRLSSTWKLKPRGRAARTCLAPPARRRLHVQIKETRRLPGVVRKRLLFWLSRSSRTSKYHEEEPSCAAAAPSKARRRPRVCPVRRFQGTASRAPFFPPPASSRGSCLARAAVLKTLQGRRSPDYDSQLALRRRPPLWPAGSERAAVNGRRRGGKAAERASFPAAASSIHCRRPSSPRSVPPAPPCRAPTRPWRR